MTELWCAIPPPFVSFFFFFFPPLPPPLRAGLMSYGFFKLLLLPPPPIYIDKILKGRKAGGLACGPRYLPFSSLGPLSQRTFLLRSPLFPHR